MKLIYDWSLSIILHIDGDNILNEPTHTNSVKYVSPCGLRLMLINESVHDSITQVNSDSVKG